MKQLLPAYPLFVKDPYFSFWANNEQTTNSDTIFWTGENKKLYGFIKIDNKLYCFLGLTKSKDVMHVKNITLSTYKTIYSYVIDDVELTCEFVSPLPLDDLSLLSNPTCYLNYKISSKSHHDFELFFFVHESVCYNLQNKEASNGIWGTTYKLNEYQTSYFGTRSQGLLSHSGDEVCADWGFFYLTSLNSKVIQKKDLDTTFKNAFSSLDDNAYFLVSSSKNANDTFYLTRYETASIEYFNKLVPAFYFKDNKTVYDAINEMIENHQEIENKLEKSDKEFADACISISKDYYKLHVASYRQSIAAHKLIEVDNELVFISKECGSNGCASTVDVTYPSVPLYLLKNPKLVTAMLKPIFKFARLDIWNYDFAPHDVGCFPSLTGQVYGLKDQNRQKGQFEHIGHFYNLPKNNDIYDLNMQMPVEESANMIILSYLVYVFDNDKDIIIKNIDLFDKWAHYLQEHGYEPSNQLCTDDFAGHLDKNINLSIKAIVALKCYIEMLKLLKRETQSYEESLASFIAHIEDVSKENGFLPLTFEKGDTRFSLKYNLAIDKLLKFNLFSEQLYQNEEQKYKKHLNSYGVALDERNTYTKTDWEMWVASFTSKETCEKLIAVTVKFLKDATIRVPFGDWIETLSPTSHMFKNRTVQGAIYFPLLTEKFLH